MTVFDTLTAVCIGIGLAAACGFRVFVPLLVLSAASYFGNFELADGFGWMGSLPAVMAFGLATALEIGARYIPFIDNALDTVAVPAAFVAGSLAMASAIVDMPPMFRWATAVIAGGGAAGMIQLGTATLRGASSLTTAGVANPLLATGEVLTSVILAILAVVIPLVAAALVLVVLVLAARMIYRRRKRKRAAAW